MDFDLKILLALKKITEKKENNNYYSDNEVFNFEKQATLSFNNKNLPKYKNKDLEDKIVFSILLPAYNREKLITRAIDSVLNQTFPYFELIIIDDASTDNTEDVVKKYNDKRIKYIKHDVNKGQNPAYNTGIDNSKGYYIAFIDSDDEWLPEKLEKTYLKFQDDKETGIVYTLAGYIEKGHKNIKLCRHDYLEGNIEKEVLTQSYLTSPTFLTVKKECFDKIGRLREDITVCKDDDMNFLFVKYFKVGLVKEILGIYYTNSNNRLGDNKKNVAYGWWILYQNHYDDFIRVVGKKVLANHYKKNVLSRFIKLNDKKMTKKVCLKIFELNPSLKNLYFLIRYCII